LRSTERLPGLPIQVAYLTAAAGVAAALSSTVDRGYLAPQESLGISYLPLYLAAAVVAAALAAYFLIRYYRSIRLLMNAYTVAVTFVAALALCAYSYACSSAPAALAIPVLAAAGVALGLRRARTRSISYTAAGLLIGVLLAIFIPASWTPYILLTFAAYDVFAVTRGPLRAIPHDMDILMVGLGDVSVGLGDVAFYSFAASSLEIVRGPLWALAGIALIALGAAATLILLRRLNRPMPGLTIPLILCAALFLI